MGNPQILSEALAKRGLKGATVREREGKLEIMVPDVKTKAIGGVTQKVATALYKSIGVGAVGTSYDPKKQKLTVEYSIPEVKPVERKATGCGAREYRPTL